METSKLLRQSSKGCGRKLALAVAIATITGSIHATPLDGVVIDGAANITHTENITDINQDSQNVTINWQEFDVDVNETVNFYQPNTEAMALNRVLSGDGSTILGNLNANGRVFILDANGVLFGQNAQVNVGGLVASTLNLSDSDFAQGNFSFTSTDTPASVINLGEINVTDGGAVALLGGHVSNQGIIRANLGSVALAAGNKISLDFAGDGLLNVQIDEAAAQALAYNGGLIQASGGSVLMTAQASNALLQTVVNNQGVIEAQTLEERNGSIVLLGGFEQDRVVVAGVLDASAPNGGDGGFIETSAAVVQVLPAAQVTTFAPVGETGLWLIDPTDLDISYEGLNDDESHVSTQALQNSLAVSNITVETVALGVEPGNITVVDPIVWASGFTLTLDAHNNININDYIQAPNGGLTLSAVGSISTGVEGHVNVDTFTLNGGSWSQIAASLPTFLADDFIINGGTFTRATGGDGAGAALQITDVYGLQGLDTTPTLNAVLTNDIDASGTVNWNAGEGFNPIGTVLSVLYEGDFDGDGFNITGLTINRPSEDTVGLFAALNATASISNLGLMGASVIGNANLGGLVGDNSGSITNSFTTGSVSGLETVGGLVGINNGIVSTTYSTASVTFVNANTGGGLVGVNNTGIDNSYATGVVTGVAAEGGFVGTNTPTGTITSSFWDSFTSTQAADIGLDLNTQTVAEVTGNWAIAEDAYSEATYAGFDFTNNWFISEGLSRPMLRAFLDGTNVSNLYQLQGIAGDLTASYTITQDIDASATAASVLAGNGGDFSDVWGGRGFATLGRSGDIFSGALNGAEFTITDLTINRPTDSYIGLFGDTSGNISNLTLIGASIVGNQNVGMLAGRSTGVITDTSVQGSVDGSLRLGGLVGWNNNASISNSFSDGDVGLSSNGILVGGLVGANLSSGTINNSYSTANVNGNTVIGGLVGVSDNGGTSISVSYATGTVTGNDEVGGLVGVNGAAITESYASGLVAGGTSGGLVGNNIAAGTITDAYFDTFTTGQATGFGANAGTITSLTSVDGEWVPGPVPDAYLEATYTGLDFTNDWFIAEGGSRPMLRAFLNGTNISTLYDLQGMAANPAGNYTLTQDIDASETLASVTAGNGGNFSDVTGGRGFAPIDSFSGTLNGANYVIDNLNINRPDDTLVGLIDILSGTVNNLGITNADVTGGPGVGIIAAINGGNINNTYTAGAVEGTIIVGGLTGQNTGAITNSYTAVTVNGDSLVGGLVGWADLTSSITNSYSLGAVTGGSETGGLVGLQVATATTANSFWNTDATATGVGTGSTVGTTGLTALEFTDINSFAAWGADIDDASGTGSTWRIYDGDTTPLLRGFLTEINVTAFDDLATYDGAAYEGLHQINGTNGNGVRFGDNYAEFVSVFGQNGTPYSSDDVNSSDLEYESNSQGAVNAGAYTLTAGGLWSSQQGFDINEVDGALTIDAQDITIVSIDDANKEYGESDPTFTWEVTQGVLAPGDTLTGSLSRTSGENVGNYAITGNITGDLASGNYTVSLENGVFTITPRSIAINVTDASRPYGDEDPEFTWTIASGSLINGDSLSGSLSREAGENVGDYDITGAPGNNNYNVTVNDGVLTITPRAITIDIASFDRLYGDADPTYTWAVTSGGLVFDDELTGDLTRAAGEDVGAYAITGTPDNDLANGNYSVSINDGVLTILQRPITISADDFMRVYGEQDPDFTWSIDSGNLVEGDTVNVDLTREAGEDVRPEGYAITPSVTGDVTSDNYAITLVDGVLQITPAPLVVTASDVTSYWDLMPEFSATTEGLVLGDTEQDAFGSSLQVTSSLVLPIPDDYTLTPLVELATNNYTVTYETGILSLLSSQGPEVDTHLPAREALGRHNRANIYEARDLLDGRETVIELLVLDGGQRLDTNTLKTLGIVLPAPLLFPINKAQLTAEQKQMLQELVVQLQAYPDIKLLIEGHTSNTGSVALNNKLSQRRAKVVEDALLQYGFAKPRLSTVHYGLTQPIAGNATLEGRALNRRTEINKDETAAAE